MRILVISDLPQFVTGGAEVQASRLIESWLGLGHEITVLGRRMRGREVLLAGRQVQVRRIRTLDSAGRALRALTYALSLARLLLIHRHRTDVVYTRFLGEGAATVALLKSLGLLHAPLVSTPANTRGAGDVTFLKSIPGSSKIIGLLDRHCDAINLIAGGMDQELRDAGFSGRNFTTIPNGIPVSMPRSAVLGERRVFLCVGRLARQKGYDVLIRAVARDPEALSAGQIRIIGDGPERDTLVALAQSLSVDHIFTWLGEADQVAVRAELEAASVFLLPSRYEGMSNAGLEALERGLPLIISRCGGLDSYINSQIGWVVAPEKVDDLSLALKSALAAAPDDLVSMSRAARALVEDTFDMAVVGRRYEGLFQALLEGRQA